MPIQRVLPRLFRGTPWDSIYAANSLGILRLDLSREAPSVIAQDDTSLRATVDLDAQVPYTKNQKNNTFDTSIPNAAHPSQKFSKRVLVVRMMRALLERRRM
jgi:hypothetical protein